MPPTTRNAAQVRVAKRAKDEIRPISTKRPLKTARLEKKNSDDKEHRSVPKNVPKVRPAGHPKQNEDGHIIFKKGDFIGSEDGQIYKLLKLLGQGSYGKVAEVIDVAEPKGKSYALKMITPGDRDEAQMEIKVLRHLKRLDSSGKHLIVQLHGHFDYFGHTCLLFDKFGLSVGDFMKANKMRPFPMEQIRYITFQLCHSVVFLHAKKFTHTDLKPENLLFVDSSFDLVNDGGRTTKRVLKDASVRLIDLGSATFGLREHSEHITTRHYRAPEVVLKLGWTQSCDVWSIGCILFELYVGQVLFPDDDDRLHLAIMERTLGKIPFSMIRRKTTRYFVEGRLVQPLGPRAQYVRVNCKSLREYMTSTDPDHVELFDLIEQMLEYEPAKRIKVDEAMQHAFFARLPQHQRDTVLGN